MVCKMKFFPSDTEPDALKSIRNIGFTGAPGSYLDFGLNCLLLDTTPNPFTGQSASLDLNLDLFRAGLVLGVVLKILEQILTALVIKWGLITVL